MKFCCTFFFVICSLVLRGQDTNLISKDSLSIQYIDISNNKILFDELHKFIEDTKNSFPVFKSGFGYLTVGDFQFNSSKMIDINSTDSISSKEINITFTMGIVSTVISSDPNVHSMCSKCFPIYYSYVDQRLVLIYDSNIKWLNNNMYSYSSKNNVTSRVEECLSAALNPDFVFESFKKEKYLLSKRERATMSRTDIYAHAAFTINEGRTVIIYSDGTKAYQN